MIFNKLKNIFNSKSKTSKRKLSLLLAGLLAINGVGTSKVAFAKDNQSNNARNTYTIIEHGNYINVTGNSDKFLSYQTQIKETKEDGTLAYCLEYGKPGPGRNGAKYFKGNELSDDIRDGITYIMRSNPNTGSKETDYAIKQGAIHYYLGELQWIDDVTYGVKNRDMIVKLANEAKTAKYIPKEDIYLNIDSKDNKFILNGDNYETDWYNISSKGELKDYTLEVKDAPKGTEIINQNGEVVNNLNVSDTKFKIRVPKANVTYEHEMTVTLKGNFFVGRATQYVPGDDCIQKMGVIFEEYADAEDSVKAKITSPGSLNVLKKDEDGKTLAGAKFKLQQNGVDVTEEKSTDENGRVEFTDLVPGEYTLVETEAPDGYLVSDIQEKIQIKTGETEYIEVVNSVKKGMVEFIKTDIDTGEIIEGAKIQIQGLSETNKNIKLEFVSSKEGNKFELPVGEYEFKEIQSPDGYILSEEIGHFEIKENGEIVKVELANKRITPPENEKPTGGSPNDGNTNSKKPVEKDVNTGNPLTGDKGIMSLGLIVMVALGGLVAVNAKKKKSKIK